MSQPLNIKHVISQIYFLADHLVWYWKNYT